MSSGSNASCFTPDQPYSPFVLTGICLVSFFISVPGFTLGVYQYCIRNRPLSVLRTERLLVYLSLVAFSFSFLGCFQWIAHFAAEGGNTVASTGCTVLGYSWFAVAIFFLFITLFIGVHFFLQVCRPKCLQVTNEELGKKSKRLELAYLLLSIVLAVVCSPWPFFNGVFGYNQWICWIITIREENEECITVGSGKIVTTVFYASVLVVFLFSLGVMVMVHILVCTRGRVFPYVWVFSSYLVTTLLVMFVTMVVNFINPEIVPPVVHGVKILSIGFLPLIASLVTTIAMTFELLSKSRSVRSANVGDNVKHQYNSLHLVDNNNPVTYGSNDSAPSHWEPPPTCILADDHNEDCN